MNPPISVGLFVGGAGTRMGGVAKGLLRTPDGAETLIERLVRVCQRAIPDCSLYLVGRSDAYASLGVPGLADDPTDVGPIGGLCSLLRHAQRAESPIALALACDLPFISEAVIARLILPLAGAARVPLVGGRLQPLAAAYEPRASLDAALRTLSEGKRALMHVLDGLGPQLECVEFDSELSATLTDWDRPEDVPHH